MVVLGRKNNIFTRMSECNVPITLFHGLNDADVPFYQSIKLASKIITPNVNVKLIKGADHRLSRREDLAQIINEIKLHLSL